MVLSIDVSPITIAKILEENSQFLHRPMYQVLTLKKLGREECKHIHGLFMESIHQRLGPQAMVNDLTDRGTEDMPHYDPYEDESQSMDISHFR